MANPRVAINGFGRIGRAVFRLLSQHADIDVVAINDVTPNATLAYLTRFDTVFGRFPGEVVLEGDVMKAGLQRVRMLEQKDPAKLPWRELGIDVVVEATGRFRTREECGWHIAAGASRVILTVPGKRPYTVSNRVRYASVSLGVTSLIATTSMSFRWESRRNTARPIRPNPLMATFGLAIATPSPEPGRGSRRGGRSAPRRASRSPSRCRTR